MFSIKNPRGLNLKDRRRFVDKHNVAQYNQYNYNSSDENISNNSGLVNNKSGVIIGKN